MRGPFQVLLDALGHVIERDNLLRAFLADYDIDNTGADRSGPSDQYTL